MRLVIQRVQSASVSIKDQTIGSIGPGLLIFLGIRKDDTAADTQWLVNKAINLRIFRDEQDKMNRSLLDVQGEALVVSQFTLYGNCSNGRRPDFIQSAAGQHAIDLYDKFIREIKEALGRVETGEFGAYMQIALVNDGPVTFIVDSKK